MALQLLLTDQFGNTYPEGYRRVVYVGVDCRTKTIDVVCADYKDQAARDGGFPPYREVSYRVGPDPVPERRDDVGNLLSPSVPSFDQYDQMDAASPTGTRAQAYALAKLFPENSGAKDA